MTVEYHKHNRIDAPAVDYDDLSDKLEVYGELYQDQTGPVIVTTLANTYYPWINGNISAQLLIDILDSSIPTKFTSFQVIKTKGGWYEISFSASFLNDNTSIIHWSIFVNGLKIVSICGTESVLPNDLHCISSSGIIELFTNDIIELRTASDNAGDQIEPHLVNFHLKRIAKPLTQA